MSALTDNPFLGLTEAELTELRAQALQALTDVLKTGKSYSLPGLSLTQADLSEIRAILSDLNVAIKIADGTGSQIAQAVIRTDTKFAGRFP